MNDMDNKEAKDQASGNKDLFNEIETDLDLSFLDREKKRSKGDKDIRKTRRRASAGGGMGDHGRLIIVSAAVILAAVMAAISPEAPAPIIMTFFSPICPPCKNADKGHGRPPSA